MKPPPWKNDEAVAKFVAEIIENENAEAEMLGAYEDAMRDHPPLRASEILESMEAEAIEAAERGNFKPLGDMIENPMFKRTNWALGSKAMSLIASKLCGTFKVTKLGRPPRTTWQRDRDWKIDAAAEVKQIARILKTHYPKEKAHTARAIGIATDRAKERVREMVRKFGPAVEKTIGKVSRTSLDDYYRTFRYR
jgi:hypothetical protein